MAVSGAGINGAAQGASLGAVAGPIGALIGGAAGWFGGEYLEQNRGKIPPPPPWYVRHQTALAVGSLAVVVVGVVGVLVARKAKR